MSDAVVDELEGSGKSKKTPLLLGLILALVGTGIGFSMVFFGFLETNSAEEHELIQTETPEELPDIAFVEFEPITISLVKSQHVEHLRFRGQLEVVGAYQDDVEHVLPRVADVLNSYLRALDISELTDHTALARLRGQMLRRVQVVVGKGRVRDLLVTEFVLN